MLQIFLKLLLTEIMGSSGVAPVRFDGKDLFIPGYYGRRDLSALDVGVATGSRFLLLGECKAGIPYTATTDYPNVLNRVNWVTNTEELKLIVRDGAAYDGALFALTPSSHPGVNGVPAVGVIRVNQATRATLTEVDIDANDCIKVDSLDYGLYTNQIRYQITAGTTTGKKLSVRFETKTVEQDDVNYEIFTLVYAGAGGTNIITIDPVGNLVCTTAGPNVPADDVTISLATYDTAAEIVAYFNAHTSGTYTAVLTGDGTFKSIKLDKLLVGDAIDIKTIKTISAILQACIDWFNNSSAYCVADHPAVKTYREPDVMAAYEYLATGSEGAAVITSDYTTALANIAALDDASFVGVMTGDAAVHAVLSTHLTTMSESTGKNERQGCVGAALSAAKATMIAEAKAINNNLVGYFGSEIKRYNALGVLTTYAGFYGACEIMGMSAGNAINFAPTNKMINAIAINALPVGINDYIKAGIMVATPSSLGGIRTVRSVTTSQATNIIANEWSAMRTALYITKDHRTYVESLIGEPGDTTILESVQNRARLRLEYYVDQGWLVVDPAFGNAYRNIVFSVSGDVVTMNYEGTLVIPFNFMLVTHNFTVVGAIRS